MLTALVAAASWLLLDTPLADKEQALIHKDGALPNAQRKPRQIASKAPTLGGEAKQLPS